jgi:hypothetical protein
MAKSAAATTVDLCKVLKSDYATPKSPVLVEPAKGKYLAFEGQGEPGGDAFEKAVGALYAVAWTIKMTRKFGGAGDFKVCPLEGLWDIMDGDWTMSDRSLWRWKLLIRVPDFVTAAELKSAVKDLIAKGKPEETKSVKLTPLKEGRSVQMLHTGQFSEEGVSIDRMKAFAAGQGLRLCGLHHEIYLSDPRRCAPERLRTILRVPVRHS